jgi:small-conductance mechanosensitive channel
MGVPIFVLSIHTNSEEKKRLMKNIKGLIIVALMAVTQFANAADGIVKSIDANATREALGMTAITLVPVLVLIIVLVVLGFATQKIPGLKG